MIRLLQIKHWQLFILLIAIPIAMEIGAMVAIAISGDPLVMFRFFPLIMIVTMVIYFGWFYALGTNLYQRLPASERMSVTIFKIFLFIPALYIIILSIFISNVMFNVLSSNTPPSPFLLLLILPMHLFAMFCIFYCLYFIAKALKAVELQRPVTFSDFAGEFMLLWFFPIGVWIIQPRVNKLFEEV